MLRIAILAISLLAGGAAAWLAYSLIGSEEPPAAQEIAETVPTTAVLVAAAPVGRGDQLGPTNLQWRPWPEGAVGDGMILRENQPEAIDTYTGWVSRTPLLMGEPIRAERLAEGDGGLMSLMLTPGTRAVAVRISAESGAGGFIMPDDRVDILHTTVRDADGDGTSEPVSSTIISNVRVLAVDQVVEQGDSGARVAETATLQLTPDQVELLSSARNAGQVSLSLRPISDSGETASEGAASGKSRLSLSDAVPPEDRPAIGRQSAPPQTEQAEGPPDEEEAERPRRLLDVRIIGSGQVETIQVPDDDDGR